MNTNDSVVHSIVFGIGHKARHGKDTVAQAIYEQRSSQYDIHVYGFADALKREVTEAALKVGGMERLFDEGLRVEGAGYVQTNGNFLALPEWVQYDPNPDMTDPFCPLGKQRSLLQWWGTEYRRSVEPDYWVKKTAEKIAYDKPEIAILSDLRFPNEFAFCKEYGDTIKVFNPRVTLQTHYSEVALDGVLDSDWDAILINDGSLADLKRNAVTVFDSLMEQVRYPLEHLWGV